ncbi:MAG: lytic murein transglycosylase [bacterium]|nr:lytic murein transglycosylase [bacterium]
MSVVHYRSRILVGGAIVLSTLLVAFVIMGAVLPPMTATGTSVITDSVDTPLVRAIKIAQQHGVDSTFLARLLESPRTTFQQRVLKINVTNFAQKPNYTHHHNAVSVQKVRAFIRKHDSLLTAGEKAYGVPAEVIASILWIETKCGTVMGSTHVPSVYLSLVLSADSARLDQYVETVMVKLEVDSSKRDSIRGYVESKATKKKLWAIEQLKALDSIQRDGTVDIISLHGSWAGAFGMGQFIPTSYRRWAVDGNQDREIDLDNLSDAIHSVANYLQKNGWGPTIKQRRAAVHHYNNSNAYVDAVFTLAAKVRD